MRIGNWARSLRGGGSPEALRLETTRGHPPQQPGGVPDVYECYAGLTYTYQRLVVLFGLLKSKQINQRGGDVA